MVPGTGVRAERPSSKNSLGAYGFCRGWLYISPRHAAESNTAASSAHAVLLFLMLNVVHSVPGQALQEPSRLVELEERVARLNHEEKAVAGGEGELLHVEQRVIGHGQPVERQHAEHRRQS